MGSAALGDAIRNIRDWSMTEGRHAKAPARVSDVFGSLVFNDQVQQARVRRKRRTERSRNTITNGAVRSTPRRPTRWRVRSRTGRSNTGASHYTHWFQPMTGITAEKHDSFYSPVSRRPLDRRVQRQGAGQGRARRVELSVGRHAQHLRGARLYRLGSDESAVAAAERQQRHARHPHGVCELDRRRARQEDAAPPLDGGAVECRRFAC